MKKIYETPVTETILLSRADVLTLSVDDDLIDLEGEEF